MKKKIAIALIMTLLMFFVFILKVHAEEINVNDWKPNTSTSGSNVRLSSIGGRILGVIQVAGTIISITVLIILGIKYLCGSIEERVQYRKSMIPYLVGSIMLFAITNIVSFIYTIATDIIK